MAYDGKVVISTKLDNSGFQQGISGLGKQMDGLKSSLKGVAAAVGVAFSVAAVINFGRESVKAASDLKSAFTGLQSIVEGQGRSFADAKGFIEDYISDGLIPATNAVTAYKNLAMHGYDDTQIQQVMEALKNSSAYGRQAALTMGEAVSSATEGLKNENSILVDNAGVTKNVSMMWKDYAKSIGVGVDSLTQQQKIQAEVNGILHETRFQTGDAAKVAGDYAGQVLGLKFAINDFKIALGNVIIPINQLVIPAFKSLINAATRMINVLGQVTGALFGGMAQKQQQAASSADAAAKAEGGLADATQKAGKAAKNTLTAFDELNVLQKDTGAGEGATAGAEGGGTIPQPTETVGLESALSEAAQRILDILEPLRQISFDSLVAAAKNLIKAFQPITQKLFEGLKWAYSQLLVPLAKWTIESALPVFLELLGDVLGYINGVLELFQPLGVWLFENFLKPLASWTGGAVIEVMEKLRDIYRQVTEWLDRNKEKLQEVFSLLGPLVQSVLSGIIRQFDRIKTLFLGVYQAAIDVLVNLLNYVVGVFTGDWEQAWEGIKGSYSAIFDALLAVATYFFEMALDGFHTTLENIKAVLGGAAEWFNMAVIQPVGLAFANLCNSISTLGAACWQSLKTCWAVVSGWFDTTVVQPIKKIVTWLCTTVQTLATTTWADVSAVWAVVAGWFMDNVITPVSTFFGNMWTGITQAFSNAWDSMSVGIKAHINGWLDLLEGFASFFVGMMNSVISALNTIQVDIPDWVPRFGGNSFGINIPHVPEIKLPRLATGAVIPANREFMAVLGDQRRGTNIETPDALLRQIVREEGGGREITIRFEGSMAELVRMLKPELDMENQRQGTQLVLGGI